MGASKIARYGQAIIEELARWRPAAPVGSAATTASSRPKAAGGSTSASRTDDATPANGLSRTVNGSLSLLRGGNTAAEIAILRGIEETTVHGHFAEAIEAGLLEARECIDLDEAQIDEILAAFERTGTLESGKLASVHADLGGRYSYGILRCLLAELA